MKKQSKALRLRTKMGNEWSLNTKKYLFCLGLLEEGYKQKKIKLKQKRLLEKELEKQFKLNYWKLNPNLKNPLLKEILTRMLFTYDIGDSSLA